MEQETVSIDQLSAHLRRLGVREGMTLVVHTSFRAVRPVEDGPHGLIVALRRTLGPRGTLIMPAMSGSRRIEPFHPRDTPTCGMGVVAETFRQLPDVRRSDHPTSSFAAVGPNAAWITAPQPLAPVHGIDSPIGRVYELDGAVLLLGVDHTANTAIHLAECLANVPYRIAKWATVSHEGHSVRVQFDENDHCCRHFRLVDDWMRTAELQREGYVGHAHARLARSHDIVAIVVPRLQDRSTCLLCPAGSGCQQCDAAWASVSNTAGVTAQETPPANSWPSQDGLIHHHLPFADNACYSRLKR